MTELVLHEATKATVEAFAAHPSHALLLAGVPGSGKTFLATHLACRLLWITPDKLGSYPYFRSVHPVDGKAIPIESIRDVIHFLTLRTPGRHDIGRVVVIEQAGRLTAHGQNALLKTIEEPPEGTVLILTTNSELELLPTIRSRIQKIIVQPPAASLLRAYFVDNGFAGAPVDKAMLMSGGLPGLTQALLAEDTAHPLVVASARARDILQKTTFERLLLIDDLVKEKQVWLDTLFMLQRMAAVSLESRQASAASIKRWYHVLQSAHRAYEVTTASAQVKLAALHFMLEL